MKTIIRNENVQEYRMCFVPYHTKASGSAGERRTARRPRRVSAGMDAARRLGNLKYLAVLLAAVLLGFVAGPVIAQHDAAEYRGLLERGEAIGMDADRLESLVVRAQQRGIGPGQLQDMIAPAFELAQNDLPYVSVLQKTLEGMAKRVPAASIGMVTRDMAGGITRAAGIVDPWMARNEVRTMTAAMAGERGASASAREFRNMFIENTSHAIQQQTDEQTLREFLDMALTPSVVERNAIASVAAGMRALPEMPMTREDPAMSVRLLVRVVNAGFTPGEIQQLPDAFRSAQFHSELPADRVARGLDHQLGQNIPAAHILENLFQGNVGGGPPGFLPPGLERRSERGSDRSRDRRPPVPPPFQ